MDSRHMRIPSFWAIIPAFVSWWDYGFQEVVEGQHPTVADDFLTFSDSIGVLCLILLVPAISAKVYVPMGRKKL